MTLLEKKLVDFFETHPEATVVYVALGTLFTDLDKANNYCAGVSGSSAKTFTMEEIKDLAAAEADAGNDDGNTGNLPVDQPPVDQPPVDQPPVDQPPVDQPPVDQPPVDQPPVDQPPVDQPPVDQPPVDPDLEADIKDDEAVVDELSDALDKSKKKLEKDKNKRK